MDPRPTVLTEPARTLAIYGEYDVVVIGGGPAGIAAAASAARHGARTLLVERYGFLGGMGTAGGVTNFAGLYGRRGGQMQLLVRGVAEELLARIDALGGLNRPQDGMGGRIRVRSYDTSQYKCAADQLLVAAGVELLFHGWAASVLLEGDERVAVGASAAGDGATSDGATRDGATGDGATGDGATGDGATGNGAAAAGARIAASAGARIAALVVETKSGRQAIRGRAFIDCSGDADVAASSGVPFEIGDGHGSGLFPTTMFRVGQVDASAALAAVGEFNAINELMGRVQQERPGTYRFPREGAILRPNIDPREWRANVTQIRNAAGRAMNGVDARELSAGEVEGRRQVVEYFRFLKAEVPGFARSAIVEIAPQVGIRETRRIAGVHALTGDDIVSSARFDDAIGLNAWPMELHREGRIDWVFPRDPDNAYNHLPWRMLVPQRVDNLLVAGRCASMSHEGQSAARASGACFAMGQAAGTAAARYRGGSFAAVDVAALRRVLADDGADLDPGATSD